jgi:hypothetical protein
VACLWHSISQQDDIRNLSGSIYSAAHCNANVSLQQRDNARVCTSLSMSHASCKLASKDAHLSERCCIIRAVTNHGHAATRRLQLFDQSCLAVRLDARMHVLRIDSHCGCDGAGCTLLIPCLPARSSHLPNLPSLTLYTIALPVLRLHQTY